MQLRLAIAALPLGLSMSLTAWAQLAPSPDGPPPASTAPAAPEDDESVATFKVSANLVDVFFNVKDKNNELVPHLSKNDCTVYEDKAPQTLKNFVAESDLPITLGILLDTSGSQYRVLPLEQDAGSQFLEQVLRKKDEAFLISFDVDIDLLQDYTNSARLLARSMQKAQINTAGGGGGGIPGAGGGTIPSIGQPKGTLLYDAVYLAANQKMTTETGRKAMILLTDGEDQGSERKIGEAIAAAQRSNVMVYCILLADVPSYGNWGYSGYSAMKRLTDETGGRLINVGNNGKKLAAAFQLIQDELRTQYVATYTPTNTKLDGSFRRLSVECKGDGLKISARRGYFAVAPQQQ